MIEFWEANFKDKGAMWGFEPAESAIDTLKLFINNGLKKILIPGFGYGRNAKIFTDNGFEVTGIEISETAIDLAKRYYGDEIKVFHGSVSDMPYDKETYDGIFCFALIHLLNEKDRIKLIDDCFNQLKSDGYMVFVAISKNDSSYGYGELISKDRFLIKPDIKLFFYDSESIANEFGKYGLIQTQEIEESSKHGEKRFFQKFWQIVCKRNE